MFDRCGWREDDNGGGDELPSTADMVSVGWAGEDEDSEVNNDVGSGGDEVASGKVDDRW